MAGDSSYASKILTEILHGEYKTLKGQDGILIEMATVMQVIPQVVIKPSSKMITFIESDLIWGINPKSLKVDDTVVTIKDERSGYLVVIHLIDAKNPDPTGHPTGETMFSDIAGLKNNTKSWKPHVATRDFLPTSGNFDGDTKLVLDENKFYTWQSSTGLWLGTSITPTVTTSVDYEVTYYNEVILVDTTDASVAISLPSEHVNGKIYRIKDKAGTAGTNSIIITPLNDAIIEGAGSLSLTTNWAVASLISDGINWFRI